LAVDQEGLGGGGAERGVEHRAAFGFVDGGPAELGAVAFGHAAFLEELRQQVERGFVDPVLGVVKEQ
jgi:hypothetical protein